MATGRQARLLLTLAMVLGVHVIVVWLLVSSPQRSVKTNSEGLLLVWITRPELHEAAPELRTTTQRPRNAGPRHPDRITTSPSTTPPPVDEDNVIRPTPDWTQEIHLAAKNALANELAKQRHEWDFSHKFPTLPKKPPRFAWNYAATHRIEAIPGGGMLVHLGDNCVLILFPLPFVGCAIGRAPVNGDLFDHLHD